MLDDRKQCYVCHKKYGLHIHHIFFGKDRHKSESLKQYFTCWLCWEHHEGTYGVHGTKGKDLNYRLKRDAQRKYEKEHTREEFMKIMHKNYLWEE